jgi:hypothetical protein
MEEKKDEPLVVRGEMLLEFLDLMPIDILETLLEDIGYDEDVNPDLARLLFRSLEKKKTRVFLQGADTIVTEELFD